MTIHQQKPIAAIALCFVLILSARAATITDADWTSMNQIPGTNGKVSAVLKNKGRLYVAGKFTMAGSVFANNIAMWDGTQWNALGKGTGDSVTCLAATSDGQLYAAGYFTKADNVTVNHIAQWNGTKWDSLGPGLNLVVRSIVVTKNNTLYAAGDFNRAGKNVMNRVAKWNGTGWDTLGQGFAYSLQAMASDSAGNIYTAGQFGATSSRVSKWNGIAWSSLSGFPEGVVKKLCCDETGTIYAAGTFNWIDMGATNIVCRGVAMWNSGTWFPLGSKTDTTVEALTLDNLGGCYAGFSELSTGGTVMQWDGGAWNIVGNMQHKPVYALFCDGSGDLYAGGRFTSFDSTLYSTSYDSAWNISKWSDNRWQPINVPAINGRINAMVIDKYKNLYIGGVFSRVGSIRTNCIARWDGSGWDSLGSGISPTPEMFRNAGRGVTSLALDSAGNLYAGGEFPDAGGVPANHVARWDGTRWHGLGAGVSGRARYGFSTDVEELTCNKNGILYAAGNFDTAGNVPANAVAQWDGSQWAALGGGVNNPVAALACDERGILYAGGDFTIAGETPVKKIAQWNGTVWRALSPEPWVSPTIHSLVCHGTALFVGSYSYYVTKWENDIWTTIKGIPEHIDVLSVDNYGNLYACGTFNEADYKPANGIARWDGQSWSALGSGTGIVVNCLAISDSTMYVGGGGITAGDKVSPFLAKVNIHSPPALRAPVSSPLPKNATARFRMSGSTLLLSGIDKSDQVSLVSLSGRVIYESVGASHISLSRIKPQPVIIQVTRGGKTLSTGIVIKQ
jgi:hypothetical protein